MRQVQLLNELIRSLARLISLLRYQYCREQNVLLDVKRFQKVEGLEDETNLARTDIGQR